MDYFPLVQRFESALWVSLVCNGQMADRFDRSLGWSFGVENYRYREHRHQIYVPDSKRLAELISAIPPDRRYLEFRASCEIACARVIESAERVAERFRPNLDKAASFELLALLLEASMDAMPFLPSLVLIQNELEQDLRDALSSDLGVDPGSAEFRAFWQRALVPLEQANFVPESRGVLAMASEYREQKVDLDAHLSDLPSDWISKIQDHVEKFGWIGTFTYLNEPFAPEEILKRVQHAARSSPHELERTLQRDRDDVGRANEAMASLPSEEARDLLAVARYFMYLRFERVDVHFKAEVRTRPVQERLAELAGITRQELVMLTVQELTGWALEEARLPSPEELALRIKQGIEYEIIDGEHSWRTAPPLERELDADARAMARLGIEGSTACIGKASGAIKHVTSIADMQGFETGDVLLTPMTTPDLMFAIERAGGIVTEEGGVLCHAAIISRELNKPCLIGCRSATKAFVDGDAVELDAGEGGGKVKLVREAPVAAR
jgi:phosphohistidine swiveling domain-containing protein